MPRFTPIKKSGDSPPGDELAPAEVEVEEQRPRRARKQSRHSSPATRYSSLTLTANGAKNGLELHFPGKPDESVRNELKSAGWRWSFFNSCWYHRHTPENRRWAEQFVARAQMPANFAPANPEPSNLIRLPKPVVPLWRQRLGAGAARAA